MWLSLVRAFSVSTIAGRLDETIASLALLSMMAIPLLEIVLRPLFGAGIHNSPLLVQHLGLLLAMAGAVLAERGGHLTSLGSGLAASRIPWLASNAERFAKLVAALLCGLLTQASWAFVLSEMAAGREIAYGLPVWVLQASMPLGFLVLGGKLAARAGHRPLSRLFLALLVPALGYVLALYFQESSLPLWPALLLLLAALLSGAPVFAVLGGVALALFWHEGQPLASVPLSHYQITVNPSLPALPLFTLAGLIFAKSGAAKRLGDLLTAACGGGASGTAIAAACLCSCFTAFTGGSGVTILALGGLLLPLLVRAGLPEGKSIGLVTSASALGVLLLPSVPLIMYAIIARVPINAMFFAGLLPAMAMVAFLLMFGGFVGRSARGDAAAGLSRPLAEQGLVPDVAPIDSERVGGRLRQILAAAWLAKWEIMAPLVAIGSLVSGLVTPTESAALTAAYALFTQGVVHRELHWPQLRRSLAECGQTIGGVMLILGMALGLTNYLIDAGLPDAAVDWAQSMLPGKFAFLVALNLFLLLAGAMMEIFAALVVLVPLLLPVAASYGIDPLHFGVIFLANMEMAFLCPPAGMNIYFASAMFGKSFKIVAASVLRPLLAMFIGSLTISALPFLSTWLPGLFIK